MDENDENRQKIGLFGGAGDPTTAPRRHFKGLRSEGAATTELSLCARAHPAHALSTGFSTVNSQSSLVLRMKISSSPSGRC